MKKIILRDIIRGLREEVARYAATVGRLNRENQKLQSEVDTLRLTWRPIPIHHQWEPRDGRCALCDEDRSAVRHTAGGER